MNDSFFGLLQQKRFLPLFLTQFFGAFSDNLFRSGLLILITYDAVISAGYNTQILATAIGGLVMLPFFLFSSLAGQLADKYEKSMLVKIIKSAEIFVMALAIYGFTTGHLPILLITLFLTLTQSTFLGPIKYSAIPAYLQHNEIMAGNAVIESSTFIAILLGTIFGASLISLSSYGAVFLSCVLMASTIAGWMSSLSLEETPPGDSTLQINWNVYRETIAIIRHAATDRVLFMSIIGISWFWVVGAVMLTQIGTYGKEVVGGNQSVATSFLIIFTAGIGLGSFICSRWMKGKIDAHLVPWGTIGTTIFMIDFVIASNNINLVEPTNIGIIQFFSHINNWRIAFDLLMIAFCAGICMIPLYALLQTQSNPRECSRMIAANNIMNSFFMVISSLATSLLIWLDITILNIFLIVGLLNLFAMYRLSSIVPESILQLVLQALFKTFYKVDVRGMEHYHQTGKRVLIIANHTSFLDAALIFAFIPEKLSYAIYTQYVNKWWIKLISSGVHLFPVDPTNPMATKRLIEHLRKEKKCVIFPEGRITVTGAIMKIYDGPGMIADFAKAMILPIRIDGAQFSLFSRLKGKVRRILFPQITVTILPPFEVSVPDNLRGKERRRIISHQVYDLMVKMAFDTAPYDETLMTSLIETAKRHGMNREIVEDIQRQPMTYRQLIMRIFLLGDALAKKTAIGENVGLLLPTSAPTLVSFFALQSQGRVPAMLNFSLGAQTLINTCHLARIRLVITSRRFIEMGRLQNVMAQLEKHITLIFLEDLREEIGVFQKIKGLISSYFPQTAYRKWQQVIHPEDTAVILFTSGSEGTPKGVALSHINLNANRYQLMSLVEFTSQDTIFNVLPMFHSFGLTGGTLVPILGGVKTFLYPSPLHYRIIPVIAYEINATIFFATDTFLNRYATSAHPYDFYALRFVFAGAEKLRAETRRLWMDKFGIQVLEAYGTTEASPALTINTRMNNKIGTVGKFIPSLDYHLSPVPGIEQGGRLYVKGPNVMRGYINPESGRIVPTAAQLNEGQAPIEGWYDTGDIVDIDDQGYVSILGRAKRFAKIGGEMISLVAIEEHLGHIYPKDHHVIVTVPDSRKGERLILLTTAKIDRMDLIQALRDRGLAELMIPREIMTVDQIPLLATGKIDFRATKIMADQLLWVPPTNTEGLSTKISA